MRTLNLIKLKIISCILIIFFTITLHFTYNTFPCFFTAIFTPVNESIWEHMKLFTTSIILNGLIEYIIIKKSNIKINNYMLNLFITSTLIVPLYLIIFIPLYNIFGENMFLSISLMIICIVISQIFSYYILKSKKRKVEIISTILIIISFITYGYLTYHPIENKIFFDKKHEKYGINHYVI